MARNQYREDEFALVDSLLPHMSNTDIVARSDVPMGLSCVGERRKKLGFNWVGVRGRVGMSPAEIYPLFASWARYG